MILRLPVVTLIATSILLSSLNVYAGDVNDDIGNAGHDSLNTIEREIIENNSASFNDTGDPASEPELGSGSLVDSTQRLLSDYVIGLSKRVDHFFGGDRNLETSKGSYGCLTYDLKFIERGEIENKISGCLKLVLPNTKERFKLIISGASEDEEFQEESLEAGTETLPNLASDETSATAAIRYISELSLLKDVSTDIGVKGGTPLDPFIRVRYRKTWVPDVWLYRFTESLYYLNSVEGGALTRVDFERPIFESKLYLRITSEADFRDDENQWYLKQGFSFYQKIAEKTAVNYDLFYFGTTRPNTQVDSYLTRVRLRKNIYKDWGYLELTPQVNFEREDDFTAVASFTVTFEALFGEIRK